jgi:nicotinate-nucleotide pyrophosphorylase (carboxylating)
MSASTLKARPSKAAPEAVLQAAEVVIKASLAEDLSDGGDITSLAVVPAEATATAQVVVKQTGVIAGLDIMARVFELVDAGIEFTKLAADGDLVKEIPFLCAQIKGPARAILSAERTALNLMQRLSGIATVTNRFTQLARQQGISILDTRKTTPTLRALEKYAVLVGGGTNHRFGLYDAILIKDNHIAIAGGITKAIVACQKQYKDAPIEIEVTNLEQLKEALAIGVEKVMLDNMNPEMIAQAVDIVDGRSFIEVSGGINEQNIEQYLIPGVDAISIGALTHSVRSLDISLEIEV